MDSLPYGFASALEAFHKAAADAVAHIQPDDHGRTVTATPVMALQTPTLRELLKGSLLELRDGSFGFTKVNHALHVSVKNNRYPLPALMHAFGAMLVLYTHVVSMGS